MVTQPTNRIYITQNNTNIYNENRKKVIFRINSKKERRKGEDMVGWMDGRMDGWMDGI